MPSSRPAEKKACSSCAVLQPTLRLSDVETWDRLKDLGFLYATRIGAVDRQRRPDHPAGEGGLVEDARNESSRSRASTSRAPSPTATLQQGHRHLLGRHEKIPTRCREMESRTRAASSNAVLHHGGLRARRQQAAERQLAASAGLMAKPSGARSIETPTSTSVKPHTAATYFNLDARRPERSGRHGAQDLRLGLPHAPPRRSGAGT